MGSALLLCCTSRGVYTLYCRDPGVLSSPRSKACWKLVTLVNRSFRLSACAVPGEEKRRGLTARRAQGSREESSACCGAPGTCSREVRRWNVEVKQVDTGKRETSFTPRQHAPTHDRLGQCCQRLALPPCTNIYQFP